MIKTIYLLSGPGTKKGFSDEIKKWLKKDLCKVKTITFIASTPDSYEKNDIFVFGNAKEVVGMKNHLLDIINPIEINIIDNRISYEVGKKIIKNSDVVYLLGGDSIGQIKFLKEKKYDKVLLKYDGIIIGTSAGAMNIAKKSYYSKDKEYKKSFFYDGIGLVDVTVDPHFDINNVEQLNEAISFSRTKQIIGLPDVSAIRVIDGEVSYINKCYLFRDGILEEVN